jgi:hypothetical protein
MNVELLNKTINEITPETLVEWYNLTQYNFETIQNKLKSANDSVWLKISQIVLFDDFIREFKKKLNWSWISANQPLSEIFMGEFQDFVDWEAISQYQILSEEFIRDHQDKVNWRKISMKQTLSEDFMREFQNHVA